MLKIGDLSRIAHVTVKALRHYSRLGLLKPVWTDRYTGYRYYSLDQLPRLNRILALKDLGFSLEQIRELLDEDLPLERLRQLFDQKQQELQQRLMSEQARLERVAGRLVNLSMSSACGSVRLSKRRKAWLFAMCPPLAAPAYVGLVSFP